MTGTSAGPRARRIIEVQAQLSIEMAKTDSADSAIEKLKDSLDELIASECILCSETMIRTIDQPFTDGIEVF